MELDQPENCAKCGALPEDILMLTCNHDLCLACSARNFQRELQKKGRSANSICCELCGALTVLDESSIIELQRIANSLPPERTFNRPEQPIGISSSTNSKYPFQKASDFIDRSSEQSRLTSAAKSFDNNFNESVGTGPYKASRGFCLEHPDEEISYFCFDCLSSCICPECVIHGTHKNHEVKTVKKAYPIVRAKIEEAMNHLTGKIEELRGIEERVESHKHQSFEGTKNLKKQVGDMFAEIRQRLDRKEKEIMQNLDKMLEDSVKELDAHTKQIKNKTFTINSSFEVLQNYFASKDEVSLLNFYSNNHDKLLQSISADDINSKKLQDSLTFRHPTAFTEISEALTALQNHIHTINIDTTLSEKSMRRNDSGLSVLNNFNRQPPPRNSNTSNTNMNFSKPYAKNSQNIPSFYQQSPVDPAKKETRF